MPSPQLLVLIPDLPCQPPFSIPPVQLWEDDTLELYILSPFAAKVTIEAKENNPIGSGITYNFSQTINLQPNVIKYFRLPSSLACHTLYSDYKTNNGVHVFSDSAIKVNAVTCYRTYKEATTVMPSESIPLSPEYFVTTNTDQLTWSCYGNINHKPARSGEFAIVGIADQSIIEVVPIGNSTLRNTRKGIPFVVILKKGETFGYVSNDSDLTGSVIRSRDAVSKFAVFAGNRLSYSLEKGANGNFCKSNMGHTYEQMFPTLTWGLSYTALPLKDNSGYYTKIVAAENNTKVYINGTFYQVLQQGENFKYNVTTDTAINISADKQIAVTQFTKGATCNGHSAPKSVFGGISQIQIIPDEQWSTQANVFGIWPAKFSRNIFENYLNVLVNLADTASFKINGKSLPSSFWKISSNLNAKCYAQILIDSINYKLTSSKGFISYIYGYGPGDGYAFAASSNFKTLQNNFFWNAQCKSELITFTANGLDSFTNYNWYFGDNSAKQFGKVVQKKYIDTGWFNIVMTRQHIRTNAIDSVTKKVYIASSGIGPVLIKDTAVCGLPQFAVFAKGFDFDNVYVWNDGHPNYYKGIKGAGQYWLKITERNGCVYVDTLNVVSYPKPFSNFSVNDSVLCLNQNKSIQFTNLSTSLDSVVSYKWNFGDTVLTDTSHLISHLYKHTGTYLSHLTVRTYRGCEHDTTLRIRILKSPKANFSLSDSVRCLANNQFVLLNTSTTDTGVLVAKIWAISDGSNIANKDTINKTFSNAGIQKIVLNVTNTLGCSDSIIKYVKINKTPLVEFVSSAYSNCLSSQNFEFNYIPNIANDSIILKTWYYGSDSLQQSNNLTGVKFSMVGTHSIKLKLKSREGCEAVLSKLISVNAEPKAIITVNDSVQCLGSNTFNFTNTSAISSGQIASHQWDFGDLRFSSLSQPTNKTYTNSGIYNVQYLVISDSNCRDSANLKLVVLANPKLSAPIAKAGCLNDSVLFTVNPVSGSGIINAYAWTFGDGFVGSAQNMKHLYSAAGNYKAKVTASNVLNCRDSAFVNLKIAENPKADFVFVHYNRDNAGIRFLFLDRSDKATNWQWQFGNFGNSILKDPDYFFSDTGSVAVRLIVSNQNICYDTIERIIPVLDKIDFYFPNAFTPNGNGLNDGFGLSVSQYNLVKDYRLQVYNRWGEKLFESNNKSTQWLIPDNENILQGVYIYKAAIRDIYNIYHDIKGVVEVIR